MLGSLHYMLAEHLRGFPPFDLGAIELFSRQALGEIDHNSPHGLVQINQLSTEVFRHHPILQDVRQILGIDDASQSLVLNAALNHDFPSDQEFDPEKYGRLLAATHARQTIARQMIIRSLDQGDNFGLQSYEQEVLRTACNVAPHFDELGILWMRDITFNPVNARATELGLINPYTVMEQRDGQPQEVAWVTRYPEQIGAITGEFRHLIAKLKLDIGGTNDARELSAYFELYNVALEQEDPSKLENLWDQADMHWMRYLGRMQPIGSGIHGYHDPNNLRVFPAFSLKIESPGYAEPLGLTKGAMIKHLKLRYGHLSSFQDTVKALEQSHVFVAVEAVTAGSLDLVFAGQNFRSENKAKIFVNPVLVSHRFNLAKDLTAKVFRGEKNRQLVEDVEVPLTVIGTTFGGHEFGEGLFLSDIVKKSLGEKTVANLHEELGDLTIAGIMRDAVKAGDLPEKSLLAHVVRNLTFCLRIIRLAESTYLQGYSRNVLSWLRRMTASGFISKNPDGWFINPGAIDRLYNLVEEDLEEQVRIAETKDPDKAALYLVKTEVTPDIKDLIETVRQVSER